MSRDLPTPSPPKTLRVPEAGKLYFGIGRNASYAAAARGEIPTIQIGHRLLVPVVLMEEMLRHPRVVPAFGGNRPPHD